MATDTARDRVARVFSFLEALHLHRSPVVRRIADQPWLLWLHRLPDHPSIQIGEYEDYDPDTADEEEPAAGDADGEEEVDFILKVARPVLAPPPPVPEILRDWLPVGEKGWDDPFEEPELIGTMTWDEDDGTTTEEEFEDVPGRVGAFRKWKRARKAWAKSEVPARKATWVYEQLYELHGILQRESERLELVIGDGVLRWHLGDERVEHPILLDKVQLLFDPSIPEFTVVEVGTEAELYTALLRSIPGVEGPTIAKFQEDLEQDFYHPLGREATTDFLRRIVVTLSKHGRLAGENGVNPAAGSRKDEEPEISRTPVLFLRKREHGFADAIRSITREIEAREDVPVSLLGIVGAEIPTGPEEEETPSRAWRESRDILLSKPANPEQIRIARSLEKKGAVLVQGPPGTGKSHTIANLIGHLLAKGESVLVTAHTTKALRVLRHHLVEPLRPLCVSVLERDTDSRRQLEAAVGAIAEKMSTSSPGQLEEAASALDKERTAIVEELDARRDDLSGAVGSEYARIVVGASPHREEGRPAGETDLSPTDAARAVAEREEADGWIPGNVERGLRRAQSSRAPLPLSEAEIAELYGTNGKLSREDEAELAGELPAAGELPPPQEFAELVGRRASLEGEDKSAGERYWSDTVGVGGPREIEELKEHLADALGDLSGESRWRLSIVEAGYKGRNDPIHREPWERLLGQMREYCREAAGSKDLLLDHGPRVKATSLPLEDLLAVAEGIVARLEQGRKLGWLTGLLHPSWRYFVRHTRVSDGKPRKLEHFRAARALIRNAALLEKLKGRWDRQVASLGGPRSDEFVQPEEAFEAFAEQMDGLLSWREKKFEGLSEGLEAQGFDWAGYKDDRRQGHTNVIAGSQFADLVRLREALLEPLTKILDCRLAALRQREIEAELGRLRAYLAGKESAHAASVTRDLAEALRSLDGRLYDKAHGRLRELEGLREVLERRNDLLTRLEQAAREWARAIRNRNGVHGGAEAPGDVARAWTWKQLVCELDSRHEVSIEEIQRDIEELAERLRRTTVDLIDARAWAHQIRRTKEHPRQRQALIGWLDTVKRIGAGTGKRVPILNRRLREQMAECREAVPVWIMPLSRLPDNFDFGRTRFDVAIIDEASQSDVMAMLALWIAKKVVIVGDHEQVSPSAVGQKLDAVGKLIDEHLGSRCVNGEHLPGIPNSHLYDGRMSIYDLARQSFGESVCLLEHFRCAPDIIGFSNMLSYEGRIRPLRDPQHIDLLPSVIEYRVEDGVSQNKVNDGEARAVAALVVAATEQPEYEGKTIGAISMVGEEQALLIERLVREHLEPREIELRRFVSGNPAQFQGDERDVMVLSMVDSCTTGAALNRRAEEMYKQRFNVAASRAKDQMWVVHSLDTARDLKEGDLRRTLIEYARNPGGFRTRSAGEEARAESGLERDVTEFLASRGYRTSSQLSVGYYRVDLVVHDLEGRRLAIECDGDRHRPPEITNEPQSSQRTQRRKQRAHQASSASVISVPSVAMPSLRRSEEMARLSALERLGWKFARVRGSRFYRDPEDAMAPVLERLEELGVEADLGREEAQGRQTVSGEEGVEGGGQGLDTEPRDRVVARAQELLKEWPAGEGPGTKK